MQEPAWFGPKAAAELRSAPLHSTARDGGVSKASASPLLHYAFSLLSFCWVIYELQTGGAAREEEEERAEVRGGGQRRRAARREGAKVRRRGGVCSSRKWKLIFVCF